MSLQTKFHFMSQTIILSLSASLLLKKRALFLSSSTLLGLNMKIAYRLWKWKVKGSPTFVWEQKLRSKKKILKAWEKNNYISPVEARKQGLQELQQLQDRHEVEEFI